MKVLELLPVGRNLDGTFDSGFIKFSDGKRWGFGFYNNDTSTVYFIIDSGLVSNHQRENLERWITPKKRVKAFLDFMKIHCEFCLEETDEAEHACIHCGKLKTWVPEEENA